jgi:hypothetical protein
MSIDFDINFYFINDQNYELLSNAKKCGHNSIEQYRESGWACGVRNQTTSGVRNKTTGGGGQRNVLKQDLTLGSKGPDVAAIQRELGLPLETNPTFGPKTKSVVINFQKTEGAKLNPPLRVDGVVDNATFNAITKYFVTERDLTNMVKRVMNEDKDNKKMDLKSDLRNIINDEYSEIEPSDLVEVLEELLHYAKNDVFRSKKPNKGYITKDEVKKNFKKNYN